MPPPSELIAHYSTKAFETRLAALLFVGAVLGAEIAWDSEKIDSGVLGIALVVIVGSLAELNRRYTYSYLCACRASEVEAKESIQWAAFRVMNEAPWSSDALEPSPKTGKSKEVRRSLRSQFLNRYLLSWGTYIPGIIAGSFLSIADARRSLSEVRHLVEAGVCVVLSLLMLFWWRRTTWPTYSPEKVLKKLRPDLYRNYSRDAG